MQTTLDWPQGVTLPADKREPQAAPDSELTRASVQRASVAQMLLVARLKARNRRDLAVDTLERGAHVMWVTCKSWFSSGGPSTKDSESNKDTDAHRDR